MQTRFIGKHMKVTARLREHIESRLERLDRYRPIIEAQVVLKIEKYLYFCEITVIGKNLRIYGEGRSEENFFAAFDTAESRVAGQLKKVKEKIKNHKVASRREIGEMVALGAASPREARSRARVAATRIIRENPSRLKELTLDEAQVELETTEKAFLVFRNTRANAVSVIYRRDDGHYGLVESAL